MKRLLAIFCLFLISVFALTQDEPPFLHLVRTGKGMVQIGFHVGNDVGHDGLGVAVGYDDYNRKAIPDDFEGEIFLPDSIVVSPGRQIPIRWISRGSFHHCDGITEVHLPSTLYTISDLSFQDCKSLRQVVIPGSLHVIYPRAFIGCTGIRRIVFNAAKPPGSYNNDTFDEHTYQTATVVFPAQSAEAYINNPLCYRFRYHAETIPLFPAEKVKSEK